MRRGGFRIGVVTDLQTAAGGRPHRRARRGQARRGARRPARRLAASSSARAACSASSTSTSWRQAQDDRCRTARRSPPRRPASPCSSTTCTSTFDARTRQAIPKALGGLGDGFAGRGADLNESSPTLPAAAAAARARDRARSPSRARTCRASSRALDRTVAVIAPVAGRQAHLFSVAATTFAAFVRDPDALRDSISEGAETLRVATPALRAQRPFLRTPRRSGRPARALVARAARRDPRPRRARSSPARRWRAARPLSPTAWTAPSTRSAASPATPRRAGRCAGVTATVATLNPQLRYLGPFITVCNYWNFFWTIVADITSIRNASASRSALISAVAPNQQNGYGSQGAKRQANGVGAPPGMPAAYLHGQPGGAAVNDDGTADCEAVQRGYPSRLASFAAPDLNVTQDSHTPGSQGPGLRVARRRRQGRPQARQPGRARAARPTPARPRPARGSRSSRRAGDEGSAPLGTAEGARGRDRDGGRRGRHVLRLQPRPAVPQLLRDPHRHPRLGRARHRVARADRRPQRRQGHRHRRARPRRHRDHRADRRRGPPRPHATRA